MNAWSHLKTNPDQNLDLRSLLKGIRQQDPMSDAQDDKLKKSGQIRPAIDNRPIEPESKKLTRPGIFKWIIFIIFIAYLLLSYFHAPILTRIGSYLIVEHPLEKADLVVCLMGRPVERGLAAAEVYSKGLAPQIIIAREELPDGYAVLGEKKVHYPESRDLLVMMLQGLGVPRSALVTSERFVGSTFDEARALRELVIKNGYGSLIIVTSPTHTKRAWLTFKKVFEKDKVKIMVAPSQYSDFKSDSWWKKEKYVQEVIIEYQKLLYYTFKSIW
jgi:uncharacterized SAM-binding protein YcdF (DUF218 family)